jgi:DNA-binding CsgD family transcriptional regulator
MRTRLTDISPREGEVLRLCGDGHSNEEIAAVLVVSLETVKTHMKSIIRKLEAKNRTHAVAIGIRRGII